MSSSNEDIEVRDGTSRYVIMTLPYRRPVLRTDIGVGSQIFAVIIIALYAMIWEYVVPIFDKRFKIVVCRIRDLPSGHVRYEPVYVHTYVDRRLANAARVEIANERDLSRWANDPVLTRRNFRRLARESA